jgi:hypothetical protein
MAICIDKTECDKVYQGLAAGLCYSGGTSVFSSNKAEGHRITEILLKVALNTNNPYYKIYQNQLVTSWHLN